jgi:hypothetical protein
MMGSDRTGWRCLGSAGRAIQENVRSGCCDHAAGAGMLIWIKMLFLADQQAT